MKSDSVTIPHLCIDYPVALDDGDTEKAITLFNISSGEYEYESLGGIVQVIQRANRRFLSVSELFHVKSNTELTRATDDDEEPVLSRAKVYLCIVIVRSLSRL